MACLSLKSTGIGYNDNNVSSSMKAMDILETFNRIQAWTGPFDDADRELALTALEGGKVLYFPALAYELEAGERVFLTPDCTDGKAKNISYDPLEDAVRGTALADDERTKLAAMMRRYGDVAQQFVRSLIPAYQSGLERARTSYRPVEVKDRVSSNKKDDTRLHVDAFPSRPNHGRRIMRIFTNVNPEGKARVWNVGEPFDQFAQRFLPTVPRQMPGSARLMKWLGITKSLRTPYDHTMLNLHDNGKLDDDYQTHGPKQRVEFPPGSTWMVYTDQVLHAALEGQYVFEQTFHLDVDRLGSPESAPLRRLERLTGRVLV